MGLSAFPPNTSFCRSNSKKKLFSKSKVVSVMAPQSQRTPSTTGSVGYFLAFFFFNVCVCVFEIWVDLVMGF